VTFSISLADVERARSTGQPVTVAPPDALALMASGKVQKKREAPTSVGIIGGLPNTEINPRVSPMDWFGSYGRIGYRDRMQREWDTAAAASDAWRKGVLQREWRFKPVKGGDRNDLMVAEFADTAIRHHFRGGGGGMLGMIGMFAGLAFDGFVLAQPYYPFDRAFTLRDSDGRVVLNGANLLQMAPVGAHVVNDWVPEEGPNGSIEYGVKVYQQVSDGPNSWRGVGRDKYIAPSDLVHARYMPQGDDPAPYGIGRPLWYGYMASESLQKFLLQGAEKAAFGIPQVVISPDADPGELSTVNSLISNLRVGALVRFSLPDGYSVQWHEVPWNAGDILDALAHIQKSAHRATATQHLFTGSDNGTQALYGGQSAEFHGGVDVVCRAIVQALAEGPTDTAPIKRLLAMNFDGIRSFPEFSFGPAPVQDVRVFADALSTVKAAGLLTGDAGVEDRVRDALHLDEMPDETRERWREELEGSDDGDDEPMDDESEEVEPDEDTPAAAMPEADEAGETADESEGDDPMPVAASDAYSRSEHDRAVSGPRGRAVRRVESVLSLSETKGQQDAGKAVVAGVLARWRMRIAPVYGEQLQANAKSLGAVATLPVPGQAELVEELRRALRPVYSAGLAAVEAETERLEADPALLADLEAGTLADVGEPDGLPAPSRIVAAADSFSPPSGVRAAARRALEVRESKPESQRGMTDVGIARARDLSNGRAVSLDTLRRMKAYFDRHAVDKQGETWDEQGKGWQAWNGWGGDAGRAWVERLLKSVAACDCGASHPRMVHAGLSERMAAIALAGKPTPSKKKAKKPAVPANLDDGIDPEDAIESLARTTAVAQSSRLRVAAMTALQSAGSGGALPEQATIGAVVSDALTSLSNGPERNQAQADVNTMFGLGRKHQQLAQGSERYMLSNLFESDTCEPCLAWDGMVVDADTMAANGTPLSVCKGGDMCGCMWIGFPPDVEV